MEIIFIIIELPGIGRRPGVGRAHGNGNKIQCLFAIQKK